MAINEEFINNNKTEVNTDLLIWLSNVFDTYEGDFYFPWNNLPIWLDIYGEENNSEYITNCIKNIQNNLIKNNGGDIISLFEREFDTKIK